MQHVAVPKISVSVQKVLLIAWICFKLIVICSVTTQGYEGGGRILLGDNWWRGDDAAAELVAVCWNLDFSWTPLCIHVWLTIVGALNSNLR